MSRKCLPSISLKVMACKAIFVAFVHVIFNVFFELIIPADIESRLLIDLAVHSHVLFTCLLVLPQTTRTEIAELKVSPLFHDPSMNDGSWNDGPPPRLPSDGHRTY
jgi:hypothetical protein